MAVNISTQARNDGGDAIVDLIDSGTTNPNGFMEIRSGAIPATPQDAATGILLSTVNFALPAFGNFDNGVAIANPIADDTDIDATGTANWFRIYDRDGNGVIDGLVTLTGGGGDIEFNTIDFIKGGVVSIIAMTAIMPQ